MHSSTECSTGSPVRLPYRAGLDYEIHSATCDCVFNLQATHTAHQTVVSERLDVTPECEVIPYVDPATGTRYLRVHAARGPLRVYCESVVDLAHHRAKPSQVHELAVR